MAWQDTAAQYLGGQASAVVADLSAINPAFDWSQAIIATAQQLNGLYPDGGWSDPSRGASKNITANVLQKIDAAAYAPQIASLGAQAMQQANTIQAEQATHGGNVLGNLVSLTAIVAAAYFGLPAVFEGFGTAAAGAESIAWGTLDAGPGAFLVESGTSAAYQGAAFTAVEGGSAWSAGAAPWWETATIPNVAAPVVDVVAPGASLTGSAAWDAALSSTATGGGSVSLLDAARAASTVQSVANSSNAPGLLEKLATTAAGSASAALANRLTTNTNSGQTTAPAPVTADDGTGLAKLALLGVAGIFIFKKLAA